MTNDNKVIDILDLAKDTYLDVLRNGEEVFNQQTGEVFRKRVPSANMMGKINQFLGMFPNLGADARMTEMEERAASMKLVEPPPIDEEVA